MPEKSFTILGHRTLQPPKSKILPTPKENLIFNKINITFAALDFFDHSWDRPCKTKTKVKYDTEHYSYRPVLH